MKLDGFHPTHTSTADLEPVDGPSTREGPSGGRRDVQDSSKGLESAHLWGAGGVTGAAEGIHGDEDYNNNGVPDAVELAKCLEKRPDNLASTGVSHRNDEDEVMQTRTLFAGMVGLLGAVCDNFAWVEMWVDPAQEANVFLTFWFDESPSEDDLASIFHRARSMSWLASVPASGRDSVLWV